MHPWYRPIAEIMIMTGMIGSEMAGLRRSDIDERYIHVRNSVVRKVEKPKLKTTYRERKIPITRAIRERLDILMKRAKGERLVSTKAGRPYNSDYFGKRPWHRAFEVAGLEYKPPYSMRHTFAAWSLLLGVEPLRLVGLMGHRDKTMVFQVYGNYVEGLEEDAPEVLEYLGGDFVRGPEKRQNPHSHKTL